MRQFIKENSVFLIVATVITVLSLLKIGNAHARNTEYPSLSLENRHAISIFGDTDNPGHIALVYFEGERAQALINCRSRSITFHQGAIYGTLNNTKYSYHVLFGFPWEPISLDSEYRWYVDNVCGKPAKGTNLIAPRRK